MSEVVRYVVHGRVQGVGFRAWAARRAQELGIAGWVRNRADGSVECVAVAEPDALEKFASLLRTGPALARVDGVSVERSEAGVADGRFEIR